MIILLREVKMGSLLEDFKIGLVLSGGGAKGSYEAGVFKTLW